MWRVGMDPHHLLVLQTSPVLLDPWISHSLALRNCSRNGVPAGVSPGCPPGARAYGIKATPATWRKQGLHSGLWGGLCQPGRNSPNESLMRVRPQVALVEFASLWRGTGESA